MAYESSLNLVNVTSEGLIIAAESVPNASAGRVNVYDGGVASNCVVSTGGELYVLNASTGLIDTATVYAGTLGISSAGNSGVNLTLSGGATYLQDGAAMSDVGVYNGATLYTISGTVNGLTVYTGGKLVPNANYTVSNVVINDLDVRAGGTANISGTAVINGATLAGNDGAVNIYSGVTINDLTQTAGWTRVSSGATINRATINAGALWLRTNDVRADSVTLNNGSFYVDSNNTVATNLKMTGGTVYLRAGAVISNAEMTGGVISGNEGRIENIVISNGNLNIISSKVQGFFASDVTVYGGTMVLRSATNSGANIKLSGGLAYLQSGAAMSGVEVNNGATLYAASGTLDGLTVYAGGKVTSSGTLGQLNCKDITVKQGGSMLFTNNFILTGETNIEDGAYIYLGNTNTRDEDVTAVNGVIYDLNLGINGTFGSGITLSNFTQTAGTVNITDNAVVKGGTISAGSVSLLSGAVMSNVVVHTGATLYTVSNVVINDLDVRAGGTANISGTAVLNGATFAGNDGAVNIYSGVTINDLTQTAGWTRVSSGATINRATINAGALWLRTNDVRADSVTLNDGTFYVDSNNTLATNLKMTGGTVYLRAGAVISNAEMTGGVISGNEGRIENIVISNGSFYIFSSKTQGFFASNVTMYGGTMMIRSAGNTATDLSISGGLLFMQNNGTLSNVNIYKGGTVYNISGTVNGLTVYSGGKLVPYADITVSNVVINNLDVRAGGTANISGTAVINGATFAGNDGAVNIYSGVTINDLTQTAGWTRVSSGATINRATINAGALWLQQGGASADSVTLNDGTFYVDSNNTVATNLKMTGGTVYLRAGGLISNAEMNGGTLNGNEGRIENLVVSDGNLNIISSKVQGFFASDVTVYGGTMVLRSATNSGANIKLSGGLTYLQNGAVMSGVAVYDGATLYAASGTLDGLTVYAGGKVTSSGTLSQLNCKDITVKQGGSMLFTNNFILTGETNIDDGAYIYLGNTNTRDEDVTAVNGVIYDLDLGINGTFGSGITLSNFTQTAGTVNVASNAALAFATVTGGTLNISSGAAVNAATAAGGKINVASGATLSNGSAIAGSLTVFESAGVSSFEQTGGRVIVYGADAAIDGATVYGGNMSIGNGGALNDATISGGTVVVRHVSGWAYSDNLTATASDVRIETGAGLTLESGGILQAGKLASGANLTIYKGGKAGLTSAAAGAIIDISFWDVNSGHGNTDAIITDWGTFSADAKINIYSTESDYSYKITDTANANATLTFANTAWGVYGNAAVKSGEVFANAFTSKSYDFSDGTTLSFGSVTVGTEIGDAASLTSADAITGGRAIKWDSATGVTSGNIFLAGDMTTGQAWVELDGYTGGENTTLYGAQGNSFATGTVNIYAKSGSLRNLAAGANAGGTVAAVNLTVAGAELDGTGYVGGFGNVTGKTATLISTGTFAKDFYAGALANKLATVTGVGDVSMTIDGGTFSGNIFGASAVKTDTTKGNGTRHTAGDVTLTVTGGSTTKGTQACIFAGGYATGDATGSVYTVDSVTATISGGSWGEAAGGRGIFGGIMASGVTAEVLGDVNLTISGDTTMGNVYGGGWAQKTNGKSIVGDVNLTISGGTIANVFGGGSHSTSGGTTETGDITITVSGGDISGAIYARGQLEGDTTGNAAVIFTGAADFSCGVFGYSYVGGAASDAALKFTGYTGEFAGALGGFNVIEFSDGTAMTLSTESGSVSNGKWVFDLTDRAEVLAGTSLLTWSDADFAGDSVKVSFADDAQAQGGWNIAAVAEAFSGTTFDVEVGGSEIVSGLAYDQQIASGDYQGWGFALDEGVLKFKNLA